MGDEPNAVRKAGEFMETYSFSSAFELGSLLVAPVHVRIEKLRLIIAAHAHSNTSYEIHYTERGRGSVTAGGRSYAVEPGTLYITGPGVVHEQVSDPDDPVIEYCLYLNCRRTRPEEPDYFRLFTDTAFWMGQDEGRVFPLFVQLIEENRHPRPGTKEMSETLLKQIIIKLTRMYSQQLPAEYRSSSSRVLTQAGMMPVVEDAFFYHYRTLTLDDLAVLLHLSIRQTQRLLKSCFGKTFSQKLNEARMAAASQFLLNTDLSISEIGEQTGFSSIEHFSSSFKHFTGISPTQYRREKRI